MKQIDSYGGPFIIVPDQLSSEWSGTDAKTFMHGEARGKSDYDALDYIPELMIKPNASIAVVGTADRSILLITMPFDLAIIKSDPQSTLIAQIEYAEPDCSFEHIDPAGFEPAIFTKRVAVDMPGGKHVIFDAARKLHEVGANCLAFDAVEGMNLFSYATYQPDPLTSLLLYKIEPLITVA